MVSSACTASHTPEACKAWLKLLKSVESTAIKYDQSQNLALVIAEVLDSCKKVENQLVSFAAVGVSMDKEAVQEATATCLAADKTIQVEPLALLCALLSVTHTQQTQ